MWIGAGSLVSYAMGHAMNLVFYVVLWVLLVLRIVWHRDRVRADLLHHGRCVGFFTIVAATCVFGSQSLIVAGLGAQPARRSVSLVILGGTVITENATHQIFAPGAIAIDGTDIVAVGSPATIRNAYLAAETIDEQVRRILYEDFGD